MITFITLYLVGAFVFYGYCFSYWYDDLPGAFSHRTAVGIALFFSLIFPVALFPFILSKAWKYGWRLK